MTARRRFQDALSGLASIGPRGRTIVATGGWSFTAKACAAANVFGSMPFVLEALGPKQFGIWATLVSLVTFAGFLDFGFGNGAMNLAADAHGRGQRAEVATIFRESRRVLIRVATLLAVMAALTFAIAPWNLVPGGSLAMSSETTFAAAVLAFSAIVATPLNLAIRIQLGIGAGDVAFRWQALGQLLSLAAVVSAAKLGGSLPLLCAAAVATPLITSLANHAALARSLRSHASPIARDATVASRIKQEGVWFFALQLAAAFAYSFDLAMVTALRSPDEAGFYAVVQRLYSLIPLGLSLVWAPLWPIYRQALAAGDRAWVLRTYRLSTAAAAVAAAFAGVTLYLSFNGLASLWMKTPMSASALLLGGFALWHVLEAIGSALATFLNATGMIKHQAIAAITFATGCLLTKIAVLLSYDASALPWATSATYALLCLAPLLLLLRRTIRQTTTT